MSKKMFRIGGFIGSVAVTAALVAAAAGGTGAYFTDSKAGTISTTVGNVSVGTSNLTLNYDNLLPGEIKTNAISYQALGTAAEDIWLVLPTGADFTYGPNALGRYGHFAVRNAGGMLFQSYNLSDNTSSTDYCSVDAFGHGGSAQQASTTNNADPNSYVSYCPVPNAILLSSNLQPGDSASANIDFGYTKVLKSGQNDVHAGLAQFKIVATQHGILPGDVNNP